MKELILIILFTVKVCKYIIYKIYLKIIFKFDFNKNINGFVKNDS